MIVARAVALGVTCGALFICAATQASAAGEYPIRPIRMIVPYAAGGTADILARIVAQKFTDNWHQQVIVDNRGGANGNIGSDLVAKATPDGYTMLLGTSGSNAVNPSLYSRMPYDAERDLELIAMVASTANILVVNPSSPAKSVKDLIEMARQRPGKITYGSSGVGSVLHLSGELLKTLAKIDIVHVPYKGTAPSLVDLMGGQIDTVFANLPAIVPMVKERKLRGLAVTTAKRASALPDVPTMIEAGVPNYDVASWFGIFVPSHTPRPIVTRINDEVTRALKTRDTQERLVGLGADPIFMSAKEANRYFHDEIEKWAKVVKASGAKAD